MPIWAVEPGSPLPVAAPREVEEELIAEECECEREEGERKAGDAYRYDTR